MDKAPLSIIATETEPFATVTVIQTVTKRKQVVKKTAKGNLIYFVSIFDSDSMKELILLMASMGIVDIKKRMLDIEELLAIQGFPKTYKLVGTKTKKKWMIGNAVEVSTARKIIVANSDLQLAE